MMRKKKVLEMTITYNSLWKKLIDGVVQHMVAMIELYDGTLYDFCCGFGWNVYSKCRVGKSKAGKFK